MNKHRKLVTVILSITLIISNIPISSLGNSFLAPPGVHGILEIGDEAHEELSEIQKRLIEWLLSDKFSITQYFAPPNYYHHNIHDLEKYYILLYAIRRILTFPTEKEKADLRNIFGESYLDVLGLKKEKKNLIVNSLVWKGVLSDDEKWVTETFLVGMGWCIKFNYDGIYIDPDPDKAILKRKEKVRDFATNTDEISLPLKKESEANIFRAFLHDKLSSVNFDKAKMVISILECSGLGKKETILLGVDESDLIDLLQDYQEEAILQFLQLLTLFMERSYYFGGVMGSSLQDYYSSTFLRGIINYFALKKSEGVLSASIIEKALSLFEEGHPPTMDMDWTEGTFCKGLKWSELDEFLLSSSSAVHVPDDTEVGRSL